MKKGKKGSPSEDLPPDSEGTSVDDPDEIFPGVAYSPEGFVLVHRCDERTAEWVRVFRITPDLATKTTLQEYRGGGRYRVYLKDRGDSGKFVIVTHKQIVIEGPGKVLTRYPGSDLPTGVVAGGKGGGGLVTVTEDGRPDRPRVTIDEILSAGILNLFNAQSATQSAQLEAIKAIGETARKDPGGGSWEKLLPIGEKVLELMLARQTTPGSTPMEMLKEAVDLIKEVRPPAPAQTLSEQLEGLDSLLNLKDRLAPVPAEPEDPVLALVRENIPRILTVLEKSQRSDPEAAALAAKIKALPKPAALPAGASSTTERPVWQLVLAARKDHLFAMAQRDKDPVTNADYESMLMEGTKAVGPFKVFLAEPDVLAQVLAAAPEFTPYADWVRIFLVRMAENLGVVPEGTTDALLAGEPEGGEEPDEQTSGPHAEDARPLPDDGSVPPAAA